VQLFSSPQHVVAKITKTEPKERLKLPIPSNVNIILERVINPIAIYSFEVTFSLKINRAISVVYSCGGFNTPMLCVGVVDSIILVRQTDICSFA